MKSVKDKIVETKYSVAARQVMDFETRHPGGCCFVPHNIWPRVASFVREVSEMVTLELRDEIYQK